MPKKAQGMKRISEGCRRFLDLWCAGVKETSVLVKECQCSERQIWRWVALLRDGMLDRHMGVEHRVKPIRPGLARGSEEQKERKAPKDDPEAMDPPVHAKRLADAWKGPKRHVELGGADHNSIGGHPDFWRLKREFLEAR